MEERHQQKVAQMIKSAEGSTGLLHKSQSLQRGGGQILKKRRRRCEVVRPFEAKRKEWAKHWPCDENVQNLEHKPWKNDELKKSEEALPDWKRYRNCTKQRQE